MHPDLLDFKTAAEILPLAQSSGAKDEEEEDLKSTEPTNKLPSDTHSENPQNNKNNHATAPITPTTPRIQNPYRRFVRPNNETTTPTATNVSIAITETAAENATTTNNLNPTDTPHPSTTCPSDPSPKHSTNLQNNPNYQTPSILRTPKYTTTSLAYKLAGDNNNTASIAQDLTLDPKLEPLRAVIASQFPVFKEFIIELANNSLASSKKNTEKQVSLGRFGDRSESNTPFVPRSIRLNTELTTSKSFRDDPTFKTLRDEFQMHVLEFQTKATETMRKWAEQEVKLLKIQRWNKLLPLIFTIIEGLILYQNLQEIKPSWPNISDKNLPLLMLAIYLKITEQNKDQAFVFLDLSFDTLLYHASHHRDETSPIETSRSITAQTSIELSNLTHNDSLDFVLSNLHQVMVATTYKTFHHNTDIQKKIENEAKLTAFMQWKKLESATTLTAQALDKASANMNASSTMEKLNQLKIRELQTT